MLAPLALLVFILIIWELLRFYRRMCSLPPGPFALPIVGNFFNEVKPPFLHDDFKRLSARFGPVFTVHMPYPVVNIADFEMIKDTYRSSDVTGRMKSVILDKIREIDNGGILGSEGDSWMDQRRFLVSTLRDFGMGKNLMEDKVRNSAQQLVEYIDKQDLSNVDLRWPVQVFVANIINEFLFGFQYPFDDCQKLLDFALGFSKNVDGFSKSRLLQVIINFPWTRHIFRSTWEQHKQRCAPLINFARERIAAVKHDHDPEAESTCYVDAFLKHNKDQRPEQLITCCLDINVAGLETTTMTLRWAVAYFAAYQDVQDKVRAEILSKIGRDRLPAMADKNNMPYTSAVLHETQRCGNLSAPNPIIFHKTTVDTKIGGFNVPAGIAISGDIHQVMKSDPVFVDPYRFWPERYLHDDGVTLRKARRCINITELVERTIPFGIGKRQCAGEGLARAELFIGLVSLIQHFRILSLPGKSVDLEPIYLNLHLPKDQNFRLERV